MLRVMIGVLEHIQLIHAKPQPLSVNEEENFVIPILTSTLKCFALMDSTYHHTYHQVLRPTISPTPLELQLKALVSSV